ncbi:hypothetical protein GQ53DRAFT_170018 [Thozetella sp. PMI_491]|nr:hypothetical protein GQ53DRAFT_170018 [Thozetella sp. PMI_491]
MYQSFDGSHHVDKLIHGISIDALATTLAPGQLFKKEGYERGMALVRDTIRNCDGCVYVYDVTNRASLESLVKLHSELDGEIEVTRGRTSRSVNICKPVLVLANKIDLPEAEWEVPHDEGRAWAKSIGAAFASNSARTGEGTSESILKMLYQIIIVAAEVHIENENFLASLLSDIPKPPAVAKPGGKDLRSQQRVGSATKGRNTKREGGGRIVHDYVGSSKQPSKDITGRNGATRGWLSKLSTAFKPAGGQSSRSPTADQKSPHPSLSDDQDASYKSVSSSLTTTMSSNSADPWKT